MSPIIDSIRFREPQYLSGKKPLLGRNGKIFRDYSPLSGLAVRHVRHLPKEGFNENMPQSSGYRNYRRGGDDTYFFF